MIYFSLSSLSEIQAVEINNNVKLKGRKVALRRLFENIIQNGLTYGNRVYVRIDKNIVITFQQTNNIP